MVSPSVGRATRILGRVPSPGVLGGGVPEPRRWEDSGLRGSDPKLDPGRHGGARDWGFWLIAPHPLRQDLRSLRLVPHRGASPGTGGVRQQPRSPRAGPPCCTRRQPGHLNQSLAARYVSAHYGQSQHVSLLSASR